MEIKEKEVKELYEKIDAMNAYGANISVEVEVCTPGDREYKDFRGYRKEDFPDSFKEVFALLLNGEQYDEVESFFDLKRDINMLHIVVSDIFEKDDREDLLNYKTAVEEGDHDRIERLEQKFQKRGVSRWNLLGLLINEYSKEGAKV